MAQGEDKEGSKGPLRVKRRSFSRVGTPHYLFCQFSVSCFPHELHWSWTVTKWLDIKILMEIILMERLVSYLDRNNFGIIIFPVLKQNPAYTSLIGLSYSSRSRQWAMRNSVQTEKRHIRVIMKPLQESLVYFARRGYFKKKKLNRQLSPQGHN